ncbi:hypothetical protein [uncultured Parabacteroides sp.]|uniref:hypothetical protein n=1 Tax=uncultured Parabacteroides sp. TaxID=512312 RepID=UPI002638FA10|nr:hypothetical protein [uncultured Parabacteroides sp.]
MLILEKKDRERVKGLYQSYNEVVKPLLIEVEVRSGKISHALQNEIRAFNDHIARCYYDCSIDLNDPEMKHKEIERQKKEIDKAEGHIRRLILDCFKQLNASLSDTVKRYEKKMKYMDPLKMGSGTEWTSYRDLKRYAVKAVFTAKIEESKDTEKSMKLFEESYLQYRKLEILFDRQAGHIRKERFKAALVFASRCVLWLFLVILAAILSALMADGLQALF